MQSKTFRGQKIISDQVGPEEIAVVWRELEKVIGANVPGDIVEFGCYSGTTSLFIRRLLDEKGESNKRSFHVYDSFEGLPAKTEQDASVAGAQFKAGELTVSKNELLHNFRTANLRPPIVHKGWFRQLTERDVPDRIAFAFLDGDFYASIMDSLKLVWPHISQGGVVLVDDYGRDALPGPERAIRDYFSGRAPIVRVEHDIVIIKA